MDFVDFPELSRRQNSPSSPYPGTNDGWSTDDGEFDAGQIARYVIIAAIVAFFFLWIVLGYIHARRRMKKGLPPLLYHRWLVPHYYRAPYRPSPGYRYGGYQGQPQQGPQQPTDQWQMQNWNYPPPPPVYSADAPPQYNVPPGPSTHKDSKGGDIAEVQVRPAAEGSTSNINLGHQ